MPGKPIKFSRTAKAATSDRMSKWDLIAAIAEDAVEASVPITGAESTLAAKIAMESVGCEYGDKAITELCLTAKFDHESNPTQRSLWRTYGWTAVRTVATAGLAQEAAAELLGGDRLTVREIEAAVRRPARAGQPGSFDERCASWVHRANGLLMDGAKLAAEAEGLDVIGGHAEMALMIYERITERVFDAEIRRLLETEGSTR